MSLLLSDEESENYLEDYFFGVEESRRSTKVYALVIYDITDNKKRTKFAKFMNGFGTRVQKSCFEVMVPESSFKKMMKKIGSFPEADDSVRVYRLTGKSQVYKWDRDGSMEEDDVIIL